MANIRKIMVAGLTWMKKLDKQMNFFHLNYTASTRLLTFGRYT